MVFKFLSFFYLFIYFILSRGKYSYSEQLAVHLLIPLVRFPSHRFSGHLAEVKDLALLITGMSPFSKLDKI